MKTSFICGRSIICKNYATPWRLLFEKEKNHLERPFKNDRESVCVCVCVFVITVSGKTAVIRKYNMQELCG